MRYREKNMHVLIIRHAKAPSLLKLGAAQYKLSPSCTTASWTKPDLALKAGLRIAEPFHLELPQHGHSIYFVNYDLHQMEKEKCSLPGHARRFVCAKDRVREKRKNAETGE